MEKKELLLTELANCLLSNEITIEDISQLLTSVKPNGCRWLVYECKKLLNIDIGIDIANIISEYTTNITIYNLQKTYSLPFSLFKTPKQLTISFWCKPQRSNQYQTIISTEPLHSRPPTFGWGFRFRRENVFWFNIMTGHGYGAIMLSSKKIQINKWYHVCGTYNSLNGKVELYINGVFENNDVVNKNQFPLQFTSKCDIKIGSLVNGGEQFNGLIYDLVIYNKLLSKHEIYSYYKSFGFKESDKKYIILRSINMMDWIVNNETIWTPTMKDINQNKIELDDLFDV